MDVLNNLIKIRTEKGYSQEYMAEKLGMAQNNYSKIERGATKLTLKRLQDISNILDVSLSFLLEEWVDSTVVEKKNLEIQKEVDLWKGKYEEELRKNESLTKWLNDKEALLLKLKENLLKSETVAQSFFYKWVLFETLGETRSINEIVEGFLYYSLGEKINKEGAIPKYLETYYVEFLECLDWFSEEYPEDWNTLKNKDSVDSRGNKILVIPETVYEEVIVAYGWDLLSKVETLFFQVPHVNRFFRNNIVEIENLSRGVGLAWQDFRSKKSKTETKK